MRRGQYKLNHLFELFSLNNQSTLGSLMNNKTKAAVIILSTLLISCKTTFKANNSGPNVPTNSFNALEK